MLKRMKEQLLPKLNKQTSKEENVLNISLNDCTCPICLEILVEPVKMPCKHEICLNCFDTMLDKTNLCCPMCRMRISTWSRNARIANKLVDYERWEQIQKAFPNEIKNRIEGKTQQILADSLSSMMPAIKKPKCSEQGEIRQEYLDLIRREEERLRMEKEKEEKMSLAYIEQVLRQEGGISVNEYLQRERVIDLNNHQQIGQNQQNILPIQETNTQVQQQTIQPVLNLNTNLDNIINQEPTPNAFSTPEVAAAGNVSRKRSLRKIYEINSEFTRITRSQTLRQTTKPSIFASNINNNNNNNNSTTTSRASLNNTINISSSAMPSAEVNYNVNYSTPNSTISKTQTKNSKTKRK